MRVLRVVALATAFAPLPGFAQGPGSELARGPSVQAVTARTARVLWRTRDASSSVLRLGLPSGDTVEIVPTRNEERTSHDARIEGLDAGTDYGYAIVEGDSNLAAGPTLRIRTALPPDSERPFRFVALGDSGTGNEDQRRIARALATVDADFFIHVGDLVYIGTLDTALFEMYGATLSRSAFFPARGNHDIARSIEWDSSFVFPETDSGLSTSDYSFDWGSAHIAILEITNEQAGASPAQLEWLRADLATARATGARWKIVACHMPVYSVGPDLAANPGQALRAQLTPVADEFEVDLVLSGHDHFYHRTHPIRGGELHDGWQSPDYIEPRGTIYAISGGGGGVLYGALPRADRFLTAEYAALHHFLEVEVTPQRLTLRARDESPEPIDEFSIIQGEPRPDFLLLRGNVNGDRVVNLADAIALLVWLFQNDPLSPIACRAASDTNGDQSVDLADPIYLLWHLFIGGPAPAGPFPECGIWDDDAFCSASGC
jgi:hypothetical protein